MNIDNPAPKTRADKTDRPEGIVKEIGRDVAKGLFIGKLPVPIVLLLLLLTKSGCRDAKKSNVWYAPAFRSFEGELHLAFETPTEPADRKQDPPYLGGKLILGVFDAKTGKRQP